MAAVYIGGCIVGDRRVYYETLRGRVAIIAGFSRRIAIIYLQRHAYFLANLKHNLLPFTALLVYVPAKASDKICVAGFEVKAAKVVKVPFNCER